MYLVTAKKYVKLSRVIQTLSVTSGSFHLFFLIETVVRISMGTFSGTYVQLRLASWEFNITTVRK